MPAVQIAAGLIVAGGGTALATAVTHGSVAPQPAARSPPPQPPQPPTTTPPLR
ncbi:hypothetical protein ABZ612_26185 [Streptomyces avermitilis]|uniref:hypothetical protein n=1 Tax=Streptomyces avermitilis TaxID=33903 RepID=UPI0033F8A82D